LPLSESPPELRGRRVLVVLRVDPPALPRVDLLGDRLVVRLVDRLVDRVEGLAGDLRVEEAPLERVDRAVVVVVEAGSSPVPRPPVISRLTWRVSSSIRLVSRSTSVWLAVRFTLAWTCCRLDWIAFWPWERLRSSCRLRSGGSRFCRSLTAEPAACRAWSTRLPSLGLRVDARLRLAGIEQLLLVGG
jgi:hypothetical protein